MKRYAIVDNNAVVNVIVWDGEEPYDTTHSVVELSEGSPIGIGWALDGDQWVAPPTEPVEVDEEALAAEVARRAAREAALAKLMALGLTEEETLAITGN